MSFESGAGCSISRLQTESALVRASGLVSLRAENREQRAGNGERKTLNLDGLGVTVVPFINRSRDTTYSDLLACSMFLRGMKTDSAMELLGTRESERISC